MDSWQQEYIAKNKSNLISYTLCSVTLLAKLEEKGLIGENDRAVLTCPGITQLDQASILYDILKTKRGSYTVLLDALVSENQTGAADILDRGLSHSELVLSDDVENSSSEDPLVPVDHHHLVHSLNKARIYVVCTTIVLILLALLGVLCVSLFVDDSGSTTASVLPTTSASTTTVPSPPCDPKPHTSLLNCPEGDRWACWSDWHYRNSSCPNRRWGNYKEVLNLLRVICYCCGSCPVPDLNE